MVTFIDEWRRKFPSCMVVKRLMVAFAGQIRIGLVTRVTIAVVFCFQAMAGQQPMGLQTVRGPGQRTPGIRSWSWRRSSILTVTSPEDDGSRSHTLYVSASARSRSGSRTGGWSGRRSISCPTRRHAWRTRRPSPPRLRPRGLVLPHWGYSARAVCCSPQSSWTLMPAAPLTWNPARIWWRDPPFTPCVPAPVYPRVTPRYLPCPRPPLTASITDHPVTTVVSWYSDHIRLYQRMLRIATHVETKENRIYFPCWDKHHKLLTWKIWFTHSTFKKRWNPFFI